MIISSYFYFSNKIDARNSTTGEVVFKCNLESSVAGLTNVKFNFIFVK